MGWTIEFSDRARKTLRKLDRQVNRRIVDFLASAPITGGNPRVIGKALTGPLGGLWCYRVGDYRIICAIQDEVLCVLVVEIGNRREVYR